MYFFARGFVGRKSDTILWFLLCFLTAVLQSQVRSYTKDLVSSVELPPQYVGLTVNPKIVRQFLGLRFLVADLIWVDTLYKADIVREKKSFTDFYHAAKVIIELDPNNLYVYYFSGMYLSVIKDDIAGSTDILKEGANYLEGINLERSDSWRLPFALGYNLIFEEQNIEEGAHWIQKASQYEQAPPYLKSLAQRISTEKGRLEVGARILSDLHQRTLRTEAGELAAEKRKRIEKKMLTIAHKQELLDLNERFSEFLLTTGGYHYSRNRVFNLFLRSMSHSGKDLYGKYLFLDLNGKIVSTPVH